MKISILVHNFNRSQPLGRCLMSIASLDHRPLEVVILDAGSSDDSAIVIDTAVRHMSAAGIDCKMANCPRLGVAASRNLAARKATGDLLCFIDNDAIFATTGGFEQTVQQFKGNDRLGLISFRVLRADTQDVDPVTWVYHRNPKEWAEREFATSTFVGTGFCVRSTAFWETGGFWTHLTYSREEEDLALALIDRGWELRYLPSITVRHFPEPAGRLSLADRRTTELHNGALVLWRRLPLPFAVVAIVFRSCTMAIQARRSGISMRHLLRAIPCAFKDWRESQLHRAPVRFASVCHYAALYLSTESSHAPKLMPD